MKKFIFPLCVVLLLTAAVLKPSCALDVTDETGRPVHIAAPPRWIVSLAPGITEMLYCLGLENKIAGVTTFCDWPAAAREKTRIGGFTNPSIEKIVSLKPDLILATADGNRLETVQQLERLGLAVYVINPSDTQGVLNSILRIGEITGREEEARKLAGELQGRLDGLARRVNTLKKPRVFFQLGLEPIVTAGRGTLIDDVIGRAGGINVVGRSFAHYPRYSAEGIIGASPDVIVFAPMINDNKFEVVKRFWNNFPQVPAVKNGRIYPIDADLINRASPRIFDAIEIMALIFHPDIPPAPD